MEDKKFTWDARDTTAVVLAAITSTIALLFPVAAAAATVLNGLAVALLVRPRTRCDLRDLIALATAAVAAATVELVAHFAVPAVTILNAVVIALVLRRRG